MRSKKRLQFSALLLLIIAVVYLPLGAAVYAIVRADERQDVLDVARRRAEHLVERNLAVHRYFAKELKPSVFSAVGEKLPADYFDPRWMSSTYAVRVLNGYLTEDRKTDYQYKECAINARSPENEADPFERNFLLRAAKDRGVSEWAGVRQIRGRPYFVVMMRGESMEEGCLLCHSDPRRAPRGLVKIFGDRRSFGRKAGDLVSAISVRIPLAQAYAHADRRARSVVLSLSLVLGVSLVLFYFLGRAYLARPLVRLRDALDEAGRDDSLLGKPIEIGGSREIQQVAHAFVAMSARLKAHLDELEAEVAKRTERLTRLNQELTEEVDRRAAAEQRLLETAEFSRLLFDEAGDSIVLLLPHPGRPPTVVDLNSHALRQNGFRDKGEVVGKEVVELDTLESGAPAADRAAKIVEAGELRFEVRHRTRDGRIIPLEVHARRVDVRGVPHILAVERDISERLELEGRLRHAQKMEAVGTLAGGIAHDFNNILTPMFAHAELALLQLDEANPVREDIAVLMDAARRAADLVKQILVISRREGEPAAAPVRIDALAHETIKFLRASLPATIEMRTDVDPACGGVLGDASQLHQVLLNLCTNAGHAMAETGGLLHVTLAGTDGEAIGRGGRWVHLSVSDTGTGIPDDVRGRIFEPYFTTKPAGKGSGLGLSVVHGIVTRMGGEISVESRTGRGTTFHVWLPEVPVAEPSALPDPAPVPKGEGERILVVDDEDAIRKVLGRILSSLGYRVTACSNGAAALEDLRHSPDRIDAVLTDQTMPEMTGTEMARQMLAIRPDLPIVLATGYAESLDSRSAATFGIAAFLMKPYNTAKLAEALHRVLDRRGEGAQPAGLA